MDPIPLAGPMIARLSERLADSITEGSSDANAGIKIAGHVLGFAVDPVGSLIGYALRALR
jgi:hypothetical protein